MIIEVTELSDLFNAIEMMVKQSNISEDKKKDITLNFIHLANVGFQLGKNGSTKFDLGEHYVKRD